MSKTKTTKNDDVKNVDVQNVHNARTQKNCFTIVQLCRENNIDAKIARRRMRDAIKRNDERVIVARERDNVVDDQRVKHEFRDTTKNRELILSIITNKRS